MLCGLPHYTELLDRRLWSLGSFGIDQFNEQTEDTPPAIASLPNARRTLAIIERVIRHPRFDANGNDERYGSVSTILVDLCGTDDDDMANNEQHAQLMRLAGLRKPIAAPAIPTTTTTTITDVLAKYTVMKSPHFALPPPRSAATMIDLVRALLQCDACDPNRIDISKLVNDDPALCRLLRTDRRFKK